jgi:hypothetical protein
MHFKCSWSILSSLLWITIFSLIWFASILSCHWEMTFSLFFIVKLNCISICHGHRQCNCRSHRWGWGRWRWKRRSRLKGIQRMIERHTLGILHFLNYFGISCQYLLIATFWILHVVFFRSWSKLNLFILKPLDFEHSWKVLVLWLMIKRTTFNILKLWHFFDSIMVWLITSAFSVIIFDYVLCSVL